MPIAQPNLSVGLKNLPFRPTAKKSHTPHNWATTSPSPPISTHPRPQPLPQRPSRSPPPQKPPPPRHAPPPTAKRPPPPPGPPPGQNQTETASRCTIVPAAKPN